MKNKTEKDELKLRRDFMKKFGTYVVGLPAVTYTLMSPLSSKATAASAPPKPPGGATAPPTAPGGAPAPPSPPSVNVPPPPP